VDSDIPVATAATDNIAAAALAADKMAELIGGSGKVAVLVHDQTSRTGIDRRDGFVKRIKAVPRHRDRQRRLRRRRPPASTEIAKAVIQANPDLKGYFGANEGSIIGVLNAVNELGTAGQLVVIGYDAGQLQKDAVRSGAVAGSITQNPVGIGYKCVKAAYMAIQGQPVDPKVIDTGFFWYDASNMDEDSSSRCCTTDPA
jgi:ribose transport system substrate-binding protein